MCCDIMLTPLGTHKKLKTEQKRKNFAKEPKLANQFAAIISYKLHTKISWVN